jgi:hypothetical protein
MNRAGSARNVLSRRRTIPQDVQTARRGTLGPLAEDTRLSDEQLSEETATGLDDSAGPTDSGPTSQTKT